MRIATYIQQGAFAILTFGVISAGGRTQTRSAPSAAARASSASAPRADSASQKIDSAQLQRDMERLQAEMKAQTSVIRAEAAELKAEVTKEMAESGIANRADLDRLAAQVHAQQAEIAARARAGAMKAQQLFAQTPGFLDAGEDAGWLGIEISEITPEKAKALKLPQPEGALVAGVLADGPSAKAGLKLNDVILEYDGHPVEGTIQFRRLVRETPPGRSVEVTVMRDGHDDTLTVRVGSRARSMDSNLREILPARGFDFKFNMPEFFPGATPVLGIEAEDITGQLGAYFHVPGGKGVLVRDVSPNTPAAKAGLKAGDVITRVDGAAVKSAGELRDQLREKRDDKSVSLTIVRQGAEMNVPVVMEAPAPPAIATRSATL